jgi:hypothetical protein
MKSHLVVGLGEVGSAIREVLGAVGHDPFKGEEAHGHYDIMHVCFPFSPKVYNFAAEVRKYKKIFSPDLVVIHSTVPVGTSRKLNAVHSPIRGVHPHLVKGIKTFVKFFGGERAEEAAQYFREKGVETETSPRSDDTEAAKLWDTTQYGAMILLNKEIATYCAKHGLDFNIVYTLFNKTYNEGYMKLGRNEVVRPYLKYMPGPIGGHCVVPNAKIVKGHTASQILKYEKKQKQELPTRNTKSSVANS